MEHISNLPANIYSLLVQTLSGSSSKVMDSSDLRKYQPSVQDVLAVKQSFVQLNLPTELIDTIIDYAEYWPHVKSVREGLPFTVRANDNCCIVRSYPLGFVPTEDKQANFQMTDRYRSRFNSLLPQPWQESRPIPNNAKEEVLKGWAATTQPRTEHPCRKIVFTLTSHDQGWGGGPAAGGQYDGAFSWFDVGKEEMFAFKENAPLEAWNTAPWPQVRLFYRGDETSTQGNPSAKIPSPLVCSWRTVLPLTVPNPNVTQADVDEADLNNIQAPDSADHPGLEGPLPGILPYKFHHDLCPEDDTLQKNIVAERNSKTHVVTWQYNDNIHPESPEAEDLHFIGRGKNTGLGAYVKDLKMGDCITVWAKARFAGWLNVVEKVEIDVYWAV